PSASPPGPCAASGRRRRPAFRWDRWSAALALRREPCTSRPGGPWGRRPGQRREGRGGWRHREGGSSAWTGEHVRAARRPASEKSPEAPLFSLRRKPERPSPPGHAGGLLLHAGADGVRPLPLELPADLAEAHATLECPGALVGDLLAIAIHPSIAVGVGDRLDDLVGGHVGQDPRPPAEPVASQLVPRL